MAQQSQNPKPMQAHYSLLYNYTDGVPIEFFEVRRCCGLVWSANGAVGTYSEESLKEYKQESRAPSYHAKLIQEKEREGLKIVRNYAYAPDAFDFERFDKELRDGVSKSYRALLQAHEKETISAFALFTDADAMTLSTIADSVESRSNAIKTMQALNIDDAEEQARFCVFDWAIGGNDSHLDPARRLLLSQHRDVPFHRPLKPQSFKPRVFDACIGALEALRKEGLFNAGRSKEEFLLLFEIADEDVVKGMVERLNSRKLAKAFFKWLNEAN